MTELLYKDLTYQIIGTLYDVHNELGGSHAEKVYQKAIAVALDKKNIHYKEQVYSKIVFQDENIGYYYLDFLIEGKVVLEIKKNKRLSKIDYDQVKKYLKTNKLKLGLLATFSNEGIVYKRVVNIY